MLSFTFFFLPTGYSEGEENASSSPWAVISAGAKSRVIGVRRGVMSYVQKI